jgi:acetyl-CoA carboxylase biotin carboxyl carrier protein
MSNKKPELDQQLIRDLAGILNDTNLTEIEVEYGELKLRVSRQAPAVHTYAGPAPSFAAAPSPSGLPAAAAAAPAADPLKNAVPSPMVGTAYASATPGTRPFVEVGQTVREGQTLLIIEAMKTMNQIPAPRAGKVTQVFVVNGQPVEYGEPLVVIE